MKAQTYNSNIFELIPRTYYEGDYASLPQFEDMLIAQNNVKSYKRLI